MYMPQKGTRWSQAWGLSFDPEINDADEVFEDKGIKILVDKKSLLSSSSFKNLSRMLFSL